jgi:hypothetical protein
MKLSDGFFLGARATLFHFSLTSFPGVCGRKYNRVLACDGVCVRVFIDPSVFINMSGGVIKSLALSQLSVILGSVLIIISLKRPIT